jgi:hypothetical protein
MHIPASWQPVKKYEAVPKLQFWNSNLRFKGKSGAFDRFFQEVVSKPTGFWNNLIYHGQYTTLSPFLLASSRSSSDKSLSFLSPAMWGCPENPYQAASL